MLCTCLRLRLHRYLHLSILTRSTVHSNVKLVNAACTCPRSSGVPIPSSPSNEALELQSTEHRGPRKGCGAQDLPSLPASLTLADTPYTLQQRNKVLLPTGIHQPDSPSSWASPRGLWVSSPGPWPGQACQSQRTRWQDKSIQTQASRANNGCHLLSTAQVQALYFMDVELI